MDDSKLTIREAVEEIAQGGYGMLSTWANHAVDNDEIDQYAKEIKDQLNSPLADSSDRVFPEHIVNALK